MLLRGAAALRNKVEDEVQVPTRSHHLPRPPVERRVPRLLHCSPSTQRQRQRSSPERHQLLPKPRHTPLLDTSLPPACLRTVGKWGDHACNCEWKTEVQGSIHKGHKSSNLRILTLWLLRNYIFISSPSCFYLLVCSTFSCLISLKITRQAYQGLFIKNIVNLVYRSCSMKNF